MDIFQTEKNLLAVKKEVYLRIKVHPGARNTMAKGVLAGEEGPTYKIDIAVAPEKGKANKELLIFLAEEFAVPKGNVKIIGGATDKIKMIKILRYA